MLGEQSHDDEHSVSWIRPPRRVLQLHRDTTPSSLGGWRVHVHEQLTGVGVAEVYFPSPPPPLLLGFSHVIFAF